MAKKKINFLQLMKESVEEDQLNWSVVAVNKQLQKTAAVKKGKQSLFDTQWLLDLTEKGEVEWDEDGQRFAFKTKRKKQPTWKQVVG